jgi:hypothetical protein
MNAIKKGCLITLAVGGAFIFISWSYVFNVRPVGNLRGPIVFEFYDESNKRIATTLTSFVISERTPARQWKPVWSLVGKERQRDITYGAKYPGLKETLAAKKLSAGKVYGVFASDGSGGSAGRYFRFKEDGAIVLPDSPE